jgi:hypothetical protein
LPVHGIERRDGVTDDGEVGREAVEGLEVTPPAVGVAVPGDFADRFATDRLLESSVLPKWASMIDHCWFSIAPTAATASPFDGKKGPQRQMLV